MIPPNNKALVVPGWLTTPIYLALKVEELAAAMVNIAVKGGEEQTSRLFCMRSWRGGERIVGGLIELRVRKTVEVVCSLLLAEERL